MDDTLIIKAGFNGPRLSGNGGYVAGLLAERYTKAFGGGSGESGGAVEITLRAPIPIETSMDLVRGDAVMMMRDGDTLICEARPGKIDHLDPPKPPSDWNAVMHQDADGGCGEGSDFQWCLVCGRSRAVGDGLRVFGSHSGNGTSLSCYVPHANHADGDGRIRPEFLWGTLDCPGAWAAQDPEDIRPALTGRMTAKVFDRPKVGERCAIVGWRIGAEGRKLYSGTALYTESGRLCAIGHCTWIVLKE